MLADPSAPTYLAGATTLAGVLHRDDALAIEAFRTGRGIGWHEHHGDLFSGTERLFRPAYAANLVDAWIPALDGVEARLRAGGTVADVGCGFGASTILLAQAFPASTFVGFDYHEAPSRPLAIAPPRPASPIASVRGRRRRATSRGPATTWSASSTRCTTWAIPSAPRATSRSRSRPTGTFMFVEPMAGETLDDNVNIVGRMFYSVAPFICTAHARSQHGPHELGNQVPDSTWDALTREAGLLPLPAGHARHRSTGCSRSGRDDALAA